MHEDQYCEAFGDHNVTNIFSGRKHYQKVYDLLLNPENPFIIWEEDTLEANCERHGQSEEKVLVVDEAEDVGEGYDDDHDQDEIGLVWRENSVQRIL